MLKLVAAGTQTMVRLSEAVSVAQVATTVIGGVVVVSVAVVSQNLPQLCDWHLPQIKEKNMMPAAAQLRIVTGNG